MAATSVGADIESICGKCGDVWHVVVAMVGDQVAKVVCKQCGGQHRYRPPGGTAKTVSRARRKAASKKPKGKSTAPEPLITVDTSKPLRPYRIAESFAVGDRISHMKFGEGVVEQIVGPQKIQVFFSGGRRVLAHERQDL